MKTSPLKSLHMHVLMSPVIMFIFFAVFQTSKYCVMMEALFKMSWLVGHRYTFNHCQNEVKEWIMLFPLTKGSLWDKSHFEEIMNVCNINLVLHAPV